MIFEVCIESLEIAQKVADFPIRRIEVCSALALGGLSPSLALVKKCSEIENLESHVMIRPREGGFEYSPQEIDVMLENITQYVQFPIRGIVIGCLQADHQIDVLSMRKILNLSQKHHLEVTFHRAFDLVPNWEEAMATLKELKVNRVLTSGGRSKAEEGKRRIQKMVALANEEIEVMAGSGVNSQNALELASLGVTALHFSAHRKIDTVPLGMGNNYEFDSQKLQSIIAKFS